MKCVFILTSWNIFFIFSQYRKNYPPFCSTLAIIAIPRPMASGLQIGGHSRANRRVSFSIKGKKKIPAFQIRCTTLQYNLRITIYFCSKMYPPPTTYHKSITSHHIISTISPDDVHPFQGYGIIHQPHRPVLHTLYYN